MKDNKLRLTKALDIHDLDTFIRVNIGNIDRISIDTETNSLDIKNAVVYNIPIAFRFKDTKKIKAFNIDLKPLKRSGNREEFQKLVKRIQELLQYIFDLKDIKVIFHNVMYDKPILERLFKVKINLETVEDTLILAYSLNHSFLNSYMFLSKEERDNKNKFHFPSIALKRLSNVLNLKDTTIEVFEPIIKSIKEHDWNSFNIHFNDYLKTNDLKMNKLEQEHFDNENWEFFDNLFNNPEVLVKELINYKKHLIDKAFKEFAETHSYGLNGLNYEQVVSQLKDPFINNEQWIKLLRKFHNIYFNISDANAQYYIKEVNYSELYDISSLILFTYATLDTKLTIQLYDKLHEVLNNEINYLYSSNKGYERKKLFFFNYREDIKMLDGLIEMKKTGFKLDVDYVLSSMTDLKETIRFSTEKMNRHLLPLINYFLDENQDLTLEEINESLKDIVGTEIESKDYRFTNLNFQSNLNEEEDTNEDNNTELKATENKKNIDFFKTFIWWLPLPIYKSKDLIKLRTWKQCIELFNLKDNDVQLYTEMLNDNRSFSFDTIKEDKFLFTFIKEEFTKAYTWIVMSIFNKLANQRFNKKTPNFIANEKALMSKLDIKGMFEGLFNKYNQEKVEEILITKKEDSFIRLQKRIEPIVIRAIKNNNLIDYTSNVKMNNDGVKSLSEVNKEIQKENLTVKWYKRTLNKETIDLIVKEKPSTLNEKESALFIHVKEFIKFKKQLMSLQKYYSTYAYNLITKVVSDKDNKRKFNYNPTGTITGRLSGDGQQMPNKGIKSPLNEKYIVFDPRQAIIPSSENHFLGFIDLDNIEMVVMAEGTIRYGIPDRALISIYAPLDCVNELGETYDYKKHRLTYKTHTWTTYTGEVWSKTDFHTETALASHPGMDIKSDEFKFIRKAAKTMNFGQPYGQSIEGMKKANPDIDPELIDEIYESKNKKFYNLNALTQTLKGKVNDRGFIYNINYRRYSFPIGSESGRFMDSYKSLNYYSQGSASYILRKAIENLQSYLDSQDTDLHMVGTVHDEIIFEGTYSLKNLKHFYKCKLIMEDRPEYNMPISSGMEITGTHWGDKKAIEYIDGVWLYEKHYKDEDGNDQIELKPLEEYKKFS